MGWRRWQHAASPFKSTLPPLSLALCPRSLSTWLNYQNQCWFSFFFPPFWLSCKEPWLKEDSQTLKISMYLVSWLRQGHCFCMWMHVFGLVSAAIILTSSLVLPKVNIFTLYVTLAHFPSGWEPALIQPGANARESMPSHPVGKEPHRTGCLLLHSLWRFKCVSVCNTSLLDISYTLNPVSL